MKSVFRRDTTTSQVWQEGGHSFPAFLLLVMRVSELVYWFEKRIEYQEKLEEIGRGIPKRKLAVQKPEQADNAILQMLLAPGRDMVRLSYLTWVADQQPVIEESLRNLIYHLDQALISYHGEFMKPAQQLLASDEHMLGKIAFDHLDFAAASGHFSEMIDLGEDLHDPDIITLGMTLQGSIFRKRGW